MKIKIVKVEVNDIDAGIAIGVIATLVVAGLLHWLGGMFP